MISLGVLEHAQNVYILIHTDTGLVGYGECSPFLSINGESMDTCAVVGGYLAKSLIGKDPLQIVACSAKMDQVIFGNSSIKSAFDIALYDIAALIGDMLNLDGGIFELIWVSNISYNFSVELSNACPVANVKMMAPKAYTSTSSP